MKSVAWIVLILLVGLRIPSVVLAHAELVTAAPGVGEQLTEAPEEVRLTFSEPVAAQSSVVVLGEGFAPVEGLVAQWSNAAPEQVYVPLPPLAPGSYTVQWTAVSADGHQISGSYSFGIGEADATATATQPAQTSVVGWLLALAAAALVIPFVVLWRRRVERKV